MGFAKQVSALVRKDFQVAKASPKATIVELMCPLLVGMIAGLFILLVGVVQNLFGGEYTDLDHLADPVGQVYVVPGPNSASNVYGNAISSFLEANRTHENSTDRYPVNGWSSELLEDYSRINATGLRHYSEVLEDITDRYIAGAPSPQSMGLVLDNLQEPRNFSVYVDSTEKTEDLIKFAMRMINLFYDPEFTRHVNDANPGSKRYPEASMHKEAFYKPIFFLLNFRAVFSSSGMGLLLLGFIPSLIITSGRLVDEKKNKVRESLKVMGTGDGAYLVSNFISSFARLGTGTILIALALAAFKAIEPAGILPVMGYGALFAFSLIAFAQIMPSLFSQSIWSNVMCIVFIWGGSTLSSMATGFELPLQFICSLCSPIAFYFAVLPILADGAMQLTFSPTQATMMLVFDTFFYLLIGNYIYAVNPGEYGVPKHPLFFLGFGRTHKMSRARIVGGGGGGMSSEDSLNLKTNDNARLPPAGPNDRVVVDNLVKYYGTNYDNPAVNGLSLRIRSGEIFALLGHNGAGKTTTMSILTGMVTASEYDEASVDGLDITKDIDAIRQTVGLCPQFDVLFNDLTARQHLELFAAIKGVAHDSERIDYLLTELELLDETKPAEKFSGGMKRRLSVGNALVGGATLIFLDEPSSGMDPLNRRRMWNLLKAERDLGKTLVLTTHFMEEADYLGDRISIMSHGHMYCCDTSQKLKETYGVGFYLSLVKPAEHSDDCNVEGALTLIQRHAPTAKLHHESSGDVTFMLPTNSLPIFGTMLADLEAELPALKFPSYGVSMNTLEDVFVSISTAEEKKGKDDKERKAIHSSDPLVATAGNRNSLDQKKDGNYGGTSVDIAKKDGQTAPPHLTRLFELAQTIPHNDRVKYQAKEIFKRKCSLLWRNRKMKMMILFCPLLFVSLAFLTMQPQPANRTLDIRGNNDITFHDNLSLLWIDLRDQEDTARVRAAFQDLYLQRYGNPVEFIICKTYECFTSGSWIPVHTLNFITGLKSPPYPGGFLMHNISLAEKTASYTMYYNTKYKPAQSMELEAMLNAAIEVAAGADPTILMNIRSFSGFPVTPNTNVESGGLSVVVGEETFNFMFTGIYTVLSLCLVLANCVIPVTDEIQRGVHHTLRVHGMTASAYYIGNLSFDFLAMLYPWVIFTIAMYVRGVPQFNSAIMVLVLLSALLLNCHLICHAYILANLKSLKPVMFTAALCGLTIVMMGAPYMIHLSLQNITPLADFADHIKPYLLSLTPSCAWYHLLDNASDQTGFMSPISSPSVVNFNRAQGMTALTFIFQIIELILPVYVLLRIVKGGGAYRQLKKDKNTRAATVTAANAGVLTTPKKQEVSGEESLLRNETSGAANESDKDTEKDPDVLAEEQRVLKGDRKDNMIAVKHLLKNFGYPGNVSCAVDEVSFGLKAGECFGLLGPNGAGKTTSCKTILREYDIDGGSIDYSYTDFDNAATQDEKFLKTRLGMCSQSNTLWEEMTAFEHMDHYLAMRLTTLYDPAAWKEFIIETINKVSLEDVETKYAGGYSGGMKRKLAVAIAMYTGAVAVFLDEPSTGMDPFARRALWNVILEALAVDRAVLLTTHSMEEADAVCARIAIMTAGQMRCIGSSQHLKNRFGSGYVVTLSLDHEKVNTEEQLEAIDAKVVAHFGAGAELTEGLGAQRKYAVGNLPSLAKAFTEIEAKTAEWGLLQYSIAQTSSLEQIFLKFVGRGDSQNDT